ncbi:hypothetical protein [Bradyrhizobium japonicum]|uniref:hypothetical protein n=1 Tax=Bradyrhizobium japonicum TaxID=375 RepID=UPI0033988157
MEDIRLPRYVIDRLEQRWTSRLQQDAKTWSIDRKKPVQARHVQTDGSRVIPALGATELASAFSGCDWLYGRNE